MKENLLSDPSKPSVQAETVIQARKLVKQYVIGGAEQHYDSFREMIMGVLSSPFKKYKKLSGKVAEKNQFCALDDVNFDIKQGDIVGIIGHNGAGKSTLLKILSRITAPTQGKVSIKGRVASLLEVGTGFHPELTGRENIYLNGSILGMKRHQIDKRFDQIVDFAGVEKFLDTPVKRYSSGMYVRLAFSVAAHLETEILLIDEVLAVGDQKFQDKCLGMLGDASSDGRTVLFVSHNLSAVSKLCNKVMVLDKGQVIFNGDVFDGISKYNNQIRDNALLQENDYIGDLYPQVSFSGIEFNAEKFNEGQEVDPFKELTITIYGHCKQDLHAYKTVLHIRKHGQLLFSLYDSLKLQSLLSGKFKVTFTIPAKLLLPGEYICSFGGITDEIDREKL